MAKSLYHVIFFGCFATLESSPRASVRENVKSFQVQAVGRPRPLSQEVSNHLRDFSAEWPDG